MLHQSHEKQVSIFLWLVPFACLLFTPNHPNLQNATPNRMITTKTNIQIEREQNT
jgi:hypothetical protein